VKTRLQVERLLRAAKRGGALTEGQESIPPHLKTRLLAHWRSRETPEDWFLPLALRRALICAGLVMMLCIVYSSSELLNDPDNDVALANFELRENVLP
jgi:hypothetical protein